jgi:hypothetical protein
MFDGFWEQRDSCARVRVGFWERDSCVRAILDARGEARLADFGLARVAKQRAGTDATVASVSAVCGTAAFLDPI